MKKILAVILAAMMIIGIVPIASFAAETGVPDGYIGVYNIEDLYCIRYALDKNYILMADIDMTEATAEGGEWDNGYGWAPIGENDTMPFTGIFDGNGHTIKGMQIRNIKTNYVGLFGYINAEIKNLNMDDVSIEVKDSTKYVGRNTYAGALAGYCNKSVISDVKISGQLINSTRQKNGYTGGVAGYIIGSTIYNCSNYAKIDSDTSAYDNYSGYNYCGGIIGYACGASNIYCCFNVGNVLSNARNSYAGGIAGCVSEYNVKIENCYNTGKIKAYSGVYANASGIACYVNYQFTVNKCINYGLIEVNTGDRSAITNAYCSNCYYLVGTAPFGRLNTTDTAVTAVALTETQMKSQPVFGNLDFDFTWFLDTSTGVMHPQLYSNYEVRPAHLHEFTETVTKPTCTEQGYTTFTCTCGKSYTDDYVDALGHDFGEWTLTKSATCTAAGEETRYCSRCDEFETRPITKLDHTYTAEVVKPTCTEKGYTSHTCICGESYKDTYVDALGHNFGSWIEIEAATCTKEGSEIRYCSRCSESETRKIAKLNHSYVDTVTKPTCTEKGYTTHTCSCGDSYVDSYVNALGHSFGIWTVVSEATCTQNGVEARYCSRCEKSETRYIAKTGHSYKYEIVKPTCTEKGYTVHTCDCGDTYKDTYVNALGHTYGEWQVTTPATCTKEGVETRYCVRCEKAETRKINALGHTYGEWKVTTPATCTKEGVETRYCTGCDKTETRTIAKIAHSYTDVVTAPTCTEKGYTTHTCDCGDTYVDSYVDVTGHIDGEWKITKPATYTAEGEKTLYCKECGTVIRTDVVPKLEGRVVSVSINNVEVKYKKSVTIKPEIKTEGDVKYTVKYETSDPKIVTVDKNGNITTKHKGTAKITCTVTDTATGESVKDTKTINVKFSFGQWLIWILLFGFLWY